MGRLTTPLVFLTGLTLATVTSNADAMELHVSYSPANFSAMYEAISAEFTKENPDITIKFEPAQTYDELLQTTLRAEVIGAAPDVSHQGFNNLRVFADRELAIPLDKFVARESDWKDQGVAEAVRNIGSVGSKTIAIPFSLSTPVLVFNNQLVSAAGGNPADLPTTWSGVFELAKKISAIEPGVSGFYMEYFSNGAFGFQTLLYSQNGKMMNENETDIAFDSPQGLAAMALLKDASDAGMIDLSTNDGRQAFVGGKIGIYEMTSSTLAGFEKQIGSRFSLTMTPIPLAVDGKMPTGGNGMVMLTKDPARQEAAWKYMKFAASPKAQAIMAAMTGYVPINKAALSDPELQKLYQDSPNYAVPLRQLKDLTVWYAFPSENGTKVTAMINSKMQSVLKGKVTPQEALGEAAKEARNLILHK